MKTEMNTALRTAAAVLTEAAFGPGLELTDQRDGSRKEVARWDVKVDKDNVLARLGCPVRISLRENTRGDMIVVALLDMSTRGDRKGAKARADRLRSQGKQDDARQALAEVSDVEVHDREDVQFQIRRLGQLLRIRKILQNKGKTVLLSMQGRRLTLPDGTIIGAANNGRTLYVRAAGSKDRTTVKNIGHAVSVVFQAAQEKDIVAKAQAAANAVLTASA